jgi:hypothetical protein
MGGACSMYSKNKSFVFAFGEKSQQKDHMEYLGMDGSKIVKWIFRNRMGA